MWVDDVDPAAASPASHASPVSSFMKEQLLATNVMKEQCAGCMFVCVSFLFISVCLTCVSVCHCVSVCVCLFFLCLCVFGCLCVSLCIYLSFSVSESM